MIDFCLDNNSIILNDDVSLILQQIDILFDTKTREVMGFSNYGTKYDTYLYDLKVSNEFLKQTVLSDLNSLNLFGFRPDVEVHLLQGTEQDIALIEINLFRDEEYYQRVYKIS